MYISYDYYRIFYYVAKYHNFTQAANALNNNQPNITRSVKNLEQELGCKLFVRSNRGVTLTPEGEKLYVRISAAMEQIQLGEEELLRDRNLDSGTVSIGASEMALHILLLPVLGRFHRKYPGVRLRISNYSTPQAIEALKNERVDFSVVSTPTGAARPLQETVLTRFQEILVGGPSYRFLAQRPRSLKELGEYPLVCHGKETKSYEFYSAFYLKQGLTLRPDVEIATIDQMLPMIKNDLGIGFLPEGFAAQALKNREIYRIQLKEQVPERYVCLITNPGRPLGIAAQELEKILLESKSQG